MCCLGCDKVVFTMSKIPGVEKRLIGNCTIMESQIRKEKGCDDYPQLGDRLLGTFCGYRFLDEQGNDVTTYRKNPVLFIFSHPSIMIVKYESGKT